MLDPRACRRLVVYGGSFDPPHRGHTQLPFAAAAAVGAQGVLFIPAGQPPHKPDRPLTPAHHRLAMLRLALGERPDAAICTYELDRPSPSYTVETLEHLRHELGPNVEMRLLIGADMAESFDTWREPRRVIALAEPLVMVRWPYELDGEWAARIVPVEPMNTSSTVLRNLLWQGQYDAPEVVSVLHDRVLSYIRLHGLYAQA